jgi:hypothetical protein
MRPRDRKWVLLLVCMCIGAVAMFCKSPGNKKSLRGPDANSMGVRSDGSERLSKTEILDIAGRALREKGPNPRRCHVTYDEENKFWRLTHPKLAVELEGRDFQAVRYMRKFWFPAAVSPWWILIDTKTGAVLRVELGEGEPP